MIGNRGVLDRCVIDVLGATLIVHQQMIEALELCWTIVSKTIMKHTSNVNAETHGF